MRFKDPSIGANGNIQNCKIAKDALDTMQRALASGGVETSSSGPSFPEIGIEIHELSHLEDYEKVLKSEFSKTKKNVEKIKLTVPANTTPDQLKMMQEDIARQYAKEWEMNAVNQIKDSTFLMNSEKRAQGAAEPALKRAIQRVKDFQKSLNCK
ncbi:MAG TPA: hypothetical protein VFF27_15620 [Bacteroidia bacterium]|jgi:hypothetical protein|nr:hypothetical protein [Bacteroidia bacterium]